MENPGFTFFSATRDPLGKAVLRFRPPPPTNQPTNQPTNPPTHHQPPPLFGRGSRGGCVCHKMGVSDSGKRMHPPCSVGVVEVGAYVPGFMSHNPENACTPPPCSVGVVEEGAYVPGFMSQNPENACTPIVSNTL